MTDLQPYLAAYGHLVALREGDLAYLHVHPAEASAGGASIDAGAPGGATPAGPQVEFVAEVPTAGSYRLFLDFRHDGVVRTAELTVPTGPADPSAVPSHADPPDTAPARDADGHGH